MKRPLMGAALAYLTGVFLGGWLQLPWPVVVVPGFLLLVLLGVSIFYRGLANWFLAMIILAYGGVAYHQLVLAGLPTDLAEQAGQRVIIKGIIDEEPRMEGNRIRYVVKVRQYRGAGTGSWRQGRGDKVLVSQKNPGRFYLYGDGVEVRGRINLPKAGGNPGEPDYSRYLKGQGIATVMYLSDDYDLKGTGEIGGNRINRIALAIRDSLARVAGATLDPEEADLLNGLVFGLRDGIDPLARQVFERVGLVHILSVSGLHVGIVAAALSFAAGLMGLPRNWGVAFGMAGVLAYGYLVGFGPAVLRAVIMIELVLLSRLTGRERDWPTALTVAAVIITLREPAVIYQPGFQLSFVATWAILYLTPLIREFLSFNVISLALAAQLGTWPLVAYYFNLFSPISLFANVALVSLVTPITWLGLGAALIGQLSIELAWLMNGATALLLKILVMLTLLFDKIPGGSFNVQSPPWWLVFIWYGLLLFWGFYRKEPRFYLSMGNILKRVRDLWNEEAPAWAGKWKVNTVLIGFLAGVFFLWTTSLAGSEGRLEVTFLDVGEGDSIYIKTPEGRHLLLDAGKGPVEKGDFDVGTKVVVPFLKRKGINRLDALIISHHHLDHGGGVPAVLSNFPVNLAVMPPLDALEGQLEDPYKPVLEAVKKQVLRVETLTAGDRLELGAGLVAEILGPPDPVLVGTTADLNNNSLVIKLIYKDISFLLTGDIETSMIEELVKGKANLQADVVKVPHHGSSGAYSEEFYRQVGAKLGVINVGPNNYGHPHQKVLDGLADQGVKVLRTDISGAVTITTDGKDMQIDTVK